MFSRPVLREYPATAPMRQGDDQMPEDTRGLIPMWDLGPSDPEAARGKEMSVSLFFFDCVRPPEMVGNEFGLELPHLHTARVHAPRIARRMMAAGADAKDWRDWTVEVSDRSGHRPSVVTFPEAPSRRMPLAARD